jgi:hypothetical protein
MGNLLAEMGVSTKVQSSSWKAERRQPPWTLPFDISEEEVWGVWVRVGGNKGAPGVDGVSIEALEKDLKDNLYRVWNRMSSGTCFPPEVRAPEGEIPSGHPTGVREPYSSWLISRPFHDPPRPWW